MNRKIQFAPLDLSSRNAASTTYRWGYIAVDSSGLTFNGQRPQWFRTQKAARAYGRQFAQSYAIARYVK